MNSNNDNDGTVKVWLPINEPYSFQSKQPPKQFWLQNPGRDVIEMDIPLRILKEWQKFGKGKHLLFG